MSRWGGFIKGRQKYREVWSELKAPSAARTESLAHLPSQFSYVEAKGIWNLTSTMQFPGSNAFPRILLEFIESAIGTTTATIPASAAAGDIAIFYAAAHSAEIASSDNPSAPAGFTRVLLNVDASDSIMYSAYKILESSDIGATLNGLAIGSDACAVIILRPSRSVSSTTVFSVNGEATISNPAPQTIDMSLIPAYNCVLAVAFMSGVDPLNETISPAMTEIVVSSDSSAFYTIFNNARTNIVVDMPDEGDNVMQSWALAIN